jgi:hypothetical protein
MASQSKLRGAPAIKQLKRTQSNISQSSTGSTTPTNRHARVGTEIGDGGGPAPKKKKTSASRRVTVEEVPDEDADPLRTSSDEETTDKDVEQEDETAEQELGTRFDPKLPQG